MSELPHHRTHIQAKIGTLDLDVDLKLTAPWTLLFGPSGSGKSSLLRALCGLIPCSTGDLKPTHLRNLAYAPQNTAIFPHLTVRENVAFASKAPHRADQALNLFHLTGLARRMPRDLSGGERQCVNLARAFVVPNPRLMLLDEPFTGLDRTLRDDLLPRMKQHLADRNIPVLSVTHDVEEALLLDAEVIRLAAGKFIAQGPAHEVLAAERSSILKIICGNSNLKFD